MKLLVKLFDICRSAPVEILTSHINLKDETILGNSSLQNVPVLDSRTLIKVSSANHNPANTRREPLYNHSYTDPDILDSQQESHDQQESLHSESG